MANRLYKVPYAHLTFTLPEELRNVAKSNPRVMYNLLFRSAWQTVKRLSMQDENIGAEPGMVSVLHTWGSDMRYHVHVHCLVTFGGLTKKHEWVNPKRRDRIAKYRKLRSTYRELFLEGLQKHFERGDFSYHLDYEGLESMVKHKTWVVNHQPPVLDTETIENYLSKYICRTAVTPKRIHYDSKTQMVQLIHKNYKKQEKGKPAPLEMRHMFALDAIAEILQHKLPVGFHKSRYYGIQSPNKAKQLREIIPEQYIREPRTMKQLLSILKLVELLLGLPDSSAYICKSCQSTNYETTIIKSDRSWAAKNIKGYGKYRGPPTIKSTVEKNKRKEVQF